MGRRDAALPVMVWTEAPGCETLGFHKNSLPKSIADKHYAAPSPELFDQAVNWLRDQII